MAICEMHELEVIGGDTRLLKKNNLLFSGLGFPKKCLVPGIKAELAA